MSLHLPMRVDGVHAPAHELMDAVFAGVERQDFRDGDDLARAVGEAGGLHDRVDGAGHLCAEGGEGDLDSAQERARLKAAEAVKRRVGVDGAHRAGVSGVQRLKEVEGLAAADFADDDAVGAEAQGGVDEVADRHLALSVLVGLARLERHDVALLQLELAGVLDHENALPFRDEGAQRVQDGRLAGARSAGDDDVLVHQHHGAEEAVRGVVHAAEGEHLVDREGVLLELADGDDRADARERRDDDMDAAAVREAGVEARMHFVEDASDGLCDVRRGGAQGLFADEAVGDLDEPAAAFDVHALMPVDHDLRHLVVRQALRHRRKKQREK